MINWFFSLLAISFLLPPLSISLWKIQSASPSRILMVSGIGLAFLVGYFISLGSWQIASFIIGHLILYYFGLSGIIAYRKNGVWLPSLINIAVLAALIFGWFLLVRLTDHSLPSEAINILLIEAIATGVVIILSFFPVVSLLSAIRHLAQVWPLISWLVVSYALSTASAWHGVFLYASLSMIYTFFIVSSLLQKNK